MQTVRLPERRVASELPFPHSWRNIPNETTRPSAAASLASAVRSAELLLRAIAKRPYRAELELCAPMGDAPASVPSGVGTLYAYVAPATRFRQPDHGAAECALLDQDSERGSDFSATVETPHGARRPR